jgi:hypothetical protein
MLNSVCVSYAKFYASNGYVFSFNDRWVLENVCEERGCSYLCILSPEMQNIFVFT